MSTPEKVSIDNLSPTRSLIDLETYHDNNFSLNGFQLSQVLGDILLVEYADLSADGKEIKRGSLWIPLSQVTMAWRIGKVLLAGTGSKYVKTGDYICFPNDKGIPTSNIDVAGRGVVKNAVFLNEDRIFGICKTV